MVVVIMHAEKMHSQKSIKNSLNGMGDKKAHKMHTLLLLWNGA